MNTVADNRQTYGHAIAPDIASGFGFALRSAFDYFPPLDTIVDNKVFEPIGDESLVTASPMTEAIFRQASLVRSFKRWTASSLEGHALKILGWTIGAEEPVAATDLRQAIEALGDATFRVPSARFLVSSKPQSNEWAGTQVALKISCEQLSPWIAVRAPRPDLPAWLMTAFEFERAGDLKLALRTAIPGLGELMMKGEWETLRTSLRAAARSDSGWRLAVSLLRLGANARDRVSGWDHIFMMVKARITQDGLKPSHVLRGVPPTA